MDLYFYLDGLRVSIPAVAALGIGVGFIAGMFGVGGGFLLVPLLHVVLGVPLPYAVGAGLAQTIATGLSAHLRHRGLGSAEGRFDVMLLGGSLLGVDAGARLLTTLEGLGTWEVAGQSLPALRVVTTASYALIFFSMAGILWFKASPEASAGPSPGPLARVPIPPGCDLPQTGLERVSGPLVGIIGFANGVVAGLIGIGGGIVLIPIMLYGFGFDIRRAAGTGIIVVLAVAVVGTFQHARLGNVHLGLVATLMVGAPLAAQVSAGLTRSLPAVTLRRGLALVLVITVAGLAYRLFG